MIEVRWVLLARASLMVLFSTAAMMVEQRRR
jgi:hypothetical protein